MGRKKDPTVVVRIKKSTYEELKRVKKEGERMADAIERHIRSVIRVY